MFRKLYQKIQILTSIFFLLNKVDNEKDIEFLNISYYSFSDAKENSILSKIKAFYDKLIYLITENSCIFQNLLYINSGYGFYKSQPLYCFDMQNIKMIKEHLKELFPETLLFYNSKKPNLAFFCSPAGGIVINEYKVVYEKFHVDNINYSEPYYLDNADNISINIILTLFHEYCGHKKYHSEFKNDNDEIFSPKKYINESNEIIELMPIKKFDSKAKNCDFILTSDNVKTGDSGHFLELSFGKLRHKLIFSYLLKFDDNGKLLNRVDLFCDNGETLKKYIELKNCCKTKKVSLFFDKNISIEDEIKEMREMIKLKTFKKLREEETKISSYDIFGKSKKEKSDIEINNLTEENSINEENEDEIKYGSDISLSEDSRSDSDSTNSLKEIEKKIAEKFNINSDDTFLMEIDRKYDDPNISLEDKRNIAYILFNYSMRE